MYMISLKKKIKEKKDRFYYSIKIFMQNMF